MTRIRNEKSSEPVSPCSRVGSLRRWDGVGQHLWWCSFARIDGECFIGRSPLSQNWRVEIRVTASVFAVTKGRHQLLGGNVNKVKSTLVQTMRLCTGRTAHKGWEVSVTPRPLFIPGNVQEAGLAPRASLDRCEKSRPSPGFDPRTVQPVGSRYTDYDTRPTLERKPTLKKISVLVSEWFIYSHNATLFAKCVTCTVVVHDAGAERLNICWICFNDLVTNKTADFLNICLQLRLSNCVPRTLGVPWENSHGGRSCFACVGIYYERVRSLLTCVSCVLRLKCDDTRAETFVLRRNGRVHLNRRGCQFSRLLAAEVCASAVVMLDTPCSEVV
jgi:hypothetical protein